MLATEYAHITLRDDGVPFITGTRTKVVFIAMDQIYAGWTPEEIQRNYSYLSLGQIHSALAYYHDHKDELDQEIARREQNASEHRAQLEDLNFIARLRSE